VTGLTLGGRDASKFMMTAVSLPLVFGAGAQLSLSLTYSPGTVGMHLGTLTIASNDPTLPLLPINLTGTGTSPTIAISPLMVDFGNILLNTPTSASQVTITNTGTASLSVTSIVLGGTAASAFTLGLPTLPAVVTPNQSATFTVAAEATALGAIDGTVTVQTDDTSVPSAVVTVHAVGVNTNPTGVGGAGGGAGATGAAGTSGTAGATGAAGASGAAGATGAGGASGAAGNKGAAGATGAAGTTGAAGAGTGTAGTIGQGQAGTGGGMVGPSGGCGCDTGGGAGTGAMGLALLGVALALRPRARRRRPATAAK
jgi:MYXO-CTERM domain-containing protein